MEEKILVAVTALASKLGVTAEKLWGVLLKQAPVSGATDLFIVAAWVLGSIVWVRFVWHKTISGDQWEDPFVGILAWGAAVIFLIIAAVMLNTELEYIVSAFVNPEYWALRQILKAGGRQ